MYLEVIYRNWRDKVYKKTINNVEAVRIYESSLQAPRVFSLDTPAYAGPRGPEIIMITESGLVAGEATKPPQIAVSEGKAGLGMHVIVHRPRDKEKWSLKERWLGKAGAGGQVLEIDMGGIGKLAPEGTTEGSNE